MKKFVGVLLALLLAGCAASESVTQIKLSSGRIYDVARTRSTVEVGDCGTQLVQYLFDEKGNLIDAKSERGHALHCDLTVAIIDAGATVGAANQIRRGIAAGAPTTSVSNSNTAGNQSVVQSQEQTQLQAQAQGQVQQSRIKVTDITRGGGNTEHGTKGHGNNGYGNGGNDGSPNGKTDQGR